MLTFPQVSRSVPSVRPFVNFSYLTLSQVKLMTSQDKCMTSIMLRSNLPSIDLNTKTGALFARKQLNNYLYPATSWVTGQRKCTRLLSK